MPNCVEQLQYCISQQRLKLKNTAKHVLLWIRLGVTNDVTNCLGRNPCRDASSYSASQEITRISITLFTKFCRWSLPRAWIIYSKSLEPFCYPSIYF